MASGNWSFDVSTWEGGSLLLARGELDLAADPDLRAALRHALAVSPCVLVELSAVSFADGRAITALLDTRERAVALGGWLRLVGTPPGVRKLIRITGLEETLPEYVGIADTRVPAGRSLQ